MTVKSCCPTLLPSLWAFPGAAELHWVILSRHLRHPHCTWAAHTALERGEPEHSSTGCDSTGSSGTAFLCEELGSRCPAGNLPQGSIGVPHPNTTVIPQQPPGKWLNKGWADNFPLDFPAGVDLTPNVASNASLTPPCSLAELSGDPLKNKFNLISSVNCKLIKNNFEQVPFSL